MDRCGDPDRSPAPQDPSVWLSLLCRRLCGAGAAGPKDPSGLLRRATPPSIDTPLNRTGPAPADAHWLSE